MRSHKIPPARVSRRDALPLRKRVAATLALAGAAATTVVGGVAVAPEEQPATPATSTSEPAGTAGERGSAVNPLPWVESRKVRFTNPVADHFAADPGVTLVGRTYVRTYTSGNAPNAFPIATSTDLVHWQKSGYIFPAGQKPAWAVSDFWAPEIHTVGDRLVAYYTARDRDTGQLSIGAAARVAGRFVDLGRPLINDPKIGMIDPTFFRDPDTGRQFLYWKSDGNAQGKPTWLYGQELTPDGLGLLGEPKPLLRNDRAYEGPLIEAPWVVKKDGVYHLSFSFGWFSNASYGGGDSIGQSPLGPFQKVDRPFLVSGNGWSGPGHFSVVPGPRADVPETTNDAGGLPLPPTDGRATEPNRDWYLVGHAMKGDHVRRAPRLGIIAPVDVRPDGIHLHGGSRNVPSEGEVVLWTLALPPRAR